MTSLETSPAEPRRYQGSRIVPIFLIFAVLLAGGLVLLKRSIQAPPRVLPVILSITDVPLTTSSGQATTLSALRGNVLLIDLQTPDCGAPCGERNRQMQEIQQWTEAIRKDMHQVTILREPVPAGQLQNLGGELKADGRWLFLSAAPEAFSSLQRELLPDDTSDLAVVDRTGRLRRRYSTRNMDDRRELMIDLRLVAAELPGAVPATSSP